MRIEEDLRDGFERFYCGFIVCRYIQEIYMS